jgi:pantetheine-phosphate adenylyltransferase
MEVTQVNRIRKALCPGSFDPVTNGHLDIIERAAKIFDQVLVTVFVNPAKCPMFSRDERIAMLEETIGERNLANVQVDWHDGLLIDYALQNNVVAIIKGLRAISDFENEFQMAQMNKWLSDRVETLFMMTSPEHSYLSSSVVKELAQFGGRITGLVPPRVETRILAKVEETRPKLGGCSADG